MRLHRLALCLAACVLRNGLLTQPPFMPLDGVVNAANYLPGCAPNGGIAQGALFTVFGRGYDAWPVYANDTQIGAAGFLRCALRHRVPAAAGAAASIAP